jgi:hypothetical protein
MTPGLDVHRAGVLRRVLLAVGVALLVLPAVAGAQATRTWVDGVSGMDANPCSITAPCKTFAGAISKTAAGGEINVLTAGGFGGVVITKSITISSDVEAGVLVSGANGITINTTGDHDTVTLRGLDFNGAGTGLIGVQILHAGTVRLENDQIYGFTDPAIDFQPTAPTASVVPALYVDDSQIHDNNQAGLRAIPPAGKTVNVFVTNSTFENDGCGLVASAVTAAPSFTTANCGVNSTGASVGTVNMTSTGNSITGNAGAGVMSAGDQATNFLISDLISGNGTGLSPVDGGKIVSIGSGNTLIGNTTDGSPTSTESPGAVGPQGPGGANGSNGANGKVELVTCKQVTVTVKKKVHGKTRKVKVKKQKCTGKLVSGPVKFTLSGKVVHATLSRSNRVIARGTMVADGGHAQGLFAVSHRVRAGWYVLTTSHGHQVLSRRSVQVG